MRVQTVLLLLLLLLTSGLKAQEGDIPSLEKANNLFDLGKKYLKDEKFKDAALAFEVALDNPLNRTTTTCIYLAGISWYRIGDLEKAKKYFNRLIQQYPLSKYADDARYHKALVLVRSEDNSFRELGLDILFSLAEYSTDASVKRDALDAAREYLFYHLNRKFVEVYFQYFDGKEKSVVMEAVCYHMIQEKQESEVGDRIREYFEGGGKPTKFLNQVRKRYGKGVANNANVTSEELRIALVLPIQSQLMTGNIIPPESQRGLELLEGMKLAVDSLAGSSPRRIRVKVYDSMNDTAKVRRSLGDLEEFSPDVIVGDVSTRTSRILARWAEENGVTQFIPLNPSTDLVNNRKNVFLTHPSIPTHGKSMARYAAKQLHFKKVVVFTDNTPIVNEIAQGFINEFTTLGGTVSRKTVPAKFSADDKTVETVVDGLKGTTFDAVYIPLSNEEIAGLIVSKMKYSGVRTRLLGSPDWENFNAIDTDLKNGFHLTYSTFFYPSNDTLASRPFEENYIEQYGKFPAKYVIQGFDVMRYVLDCAGQVSSLQQLPEFVRTRPDFHAIHEDIGFGGAQDNQKVTIVEMVEGRLNRVD